MKVVVYEGPTAEGKLSPPTETDVSGDSSSLPNGCKWTFALPNCSRSGQPRLYRGRRADKQTHRLEGVSDPQTFEVDTGPPRVTITPERPQMGDRSEETT